jgi:integral membrane protein
VSDPLTRFRVTAYLVGVGLLVLVFVAMPLKYIGHSETFISIHGPIHGLLYMLYIGTTIDLGTRAGWSPRRIVGVLLGGTVPFLSFYLERRVTRQVIAQLADDAAAAETAV